MIQKLLAKASRANRVTGVVLAIVCAGRSHEAWCSSVACGAVDVGPVSMLKCWSCICRASMLLMCEAPMNLDLAC